MSKPSDAAPANDASTAIEIVTKFLVALEQGDLDTAASFLAPKPVFIFTGGVKRQDLGDIVKGLSTRYQFVGKHFDGFDAMASEDGVTVYVRGTLHGRWADGRAFAGIRYIDRFEIRDGKIRHQEVWNDTAETLAKLTAAK